MQSKQVPRLTDRPHTPTPQPVAIDARPFALECTWLSSVPTRGLVIIANPVARSDTASPLNHVSGALQRAGFGVLLLSSGTAPSADLAAPMTRFETGLLAAKLVLATDWLRSRRELAGHTVGCLAFGPAAASAVIAGAERQSAIRSLVVVDPRLAVADRAIRALAIASTLAVVGQDDGQGMLEAAAARQDGNGLVEIRRVPGRGCAPSRVATHKIWSLAHEWFRRHLR